MAADGDRALLTDAQRSQQTLVSGNCMPVTLGEKLASSLFLRAVGQILHREESLTCLSPVLVLVSDRSCKKAHLRRERGAR